MTQTTYSYDALGRLKAVISASGDIAVYEYDGVGNLLSIEQSSSSILSISGCNPGSAPVGTPVEVHGTGFSPAATQNAVTFDGIPAAVIAATATRITASVPPGAITGPITVATPADATVSSFAFTVVPASEEPTVTEFSPTIGVEGTQVVIGGFGFDPSASVNRVTFNGTIALVTSASATVIEAVVPPAIGSGPIAIRTPSGAARINHDFFIPPAPRTAADVEVTGRIGLGERAVVTIGTPNMIALVVCDGSTGQSLNVGVSDVNFANQSGIFELSMLSPHQASLARKLIGELTDDIAVSSLPETGTYTIVVDPGPTPVSLTLTLSEPVIGVLTVGGPPVALALDIPGQRGRLTFVGNVGERVDLGVSDLTFGPGLGAVRVTILSPDGSTLASRTTASDVVIHPDPLPATDIYTIEIDPQLAETARVTFTLSETVLR